MGYLIELKRPIITWFTLTQMTMTYTDNSHPNQTNINNSAKISDKEWKFSEFDQI